MNNITQQLIIGSLFALFCIVSVYTMVGWRAIKDCYKKFLSRDYWTDYNTVEFASWLAKAFIIVPGLIFGIQFWWLYIFTLGTSLTLIWASNKKLLPTLVGFNTIWVWLSCMAIVGHFINS
jgi:hypothetical protein